MCGVQAFDSGYVEGTQNAPSKRLNSFIRSYLYCILCFTLLVTTLYCRVHQALDEDNTAANSNIDGYYNINTTDPSQNSRRRTQQVIDPRNDILNSKLDSHFLEAIVELSSSAEIDSSDRRNRGCEERIEPVVLPKGAVLKKGFQRVAVLSVSSEGLMTSSDGGSKVAPASHLPGKAHPRSTLNVTVYEVVIHGGKAFLKTKRVEVDSSDTGSAVPKIVDYSTGWQHSLLTMS